MNQYNPLTFYSVGTEESGTIHYITSSAGAGGTVSPLGEVEVPEGTNKTFYIMPDEGYHIVDVEVDSISKGAVYAYTFISVSLNQTLSATFDVTTPPTISKDKSKYDKGETVTITVSGGTANGPVMLQIQTSTGAKQWADQGNFALDGSYVYQIKIPSGWSYGTYTIHVRDVNAGTTKSSSLTIQSAAPPARPSPPPPSPPPPSNNEPTAQAGPDQSALVGREIFFDGSDSSDIDGTINTYLWVFGDGISDTGVKTSHIYVMEGEYNASLTVVDNLGATDTDTANVVVEALPLEPSNGVDEGVDMDKTNYVVDAIDTTDTTVTLNTTKPVTVSILIYPENPYPEAPLPPDSLPKIVDIFVSNHDSVTWPIFVERHYTDDDVEGLDETRLVLYYYRDGEWHMCRETGSYPDQNIVWANMYEDEVIGVPILIAQRPSLASFQLSDLTIEPGSIEPGETTTVTVTVTNIGSESGTTLVSFKINGVTEKTENITLSSLASVQVTYDVNKTSEEIYQVEVDDLQGNFEVRTIPPAEFEFSSFDLSSAQVEPGEEIQGSVRVTNIGEKSGNYTIQVELDGVQVFTDSDILAGGSSTVVTFIISSQEDGEHIVEVDDLSGSFTVVTPLTPAEFQYVISLSPTEVEPGEDIQVTIEITNTGEETGVYQFNLLLDGSLEAEFTGGLDGGEEFTESMSVSSEEEGLHTIQVNENSVNFTVIAPSPTQRIPWLIIDGFIIAAVIIGLYYARRNEWI